LTKDCPASVPKLSLAELYALLAAFIVGVYNQRPHSQIGEAPHVAWLGKGWLPRLPENCLDTHDAALQPPRRGSHARRG
jgi:putative transposase